MKRVSSRQLRCVLLLSVITLKLLFLPSLLYQECKNSAWIATLIFFAIEIIFLFIFMSISVKYPDMTFYDMLNQMFGKIIAKIFLFVYFIYFLFKAYLTFHGNFIFLSKNFYDSLEWYIYAIPLLFVTGYVVFSGVKSVVRMAEIFCPIIIFGAMVSVLLGLFDVDLTNSLPFFDGGVIDSLLPIHKYVMWFGDSIIFLTFMGNVQYEKYTRLKVILYVVGICLFVAFFILLFISMFGNNAINHKNAISDIVQILPTNSDLGGFGWVLILIWDMALFVYFSILIYATNDLFRNVFYKKFTWISLLIISILVLGITIFVGFDINKMIQFVTGICVYPAIIIQYVLPTFFLVFLFRLKEKKKWNIYLKTKF